MTTYINPDAIMNHSITSVKLAGDIGGLQFPRVYIDTMGVALPTSKDDGELAVKLVYNSSTDNFSCYGTIKVQGNTSTSYAKKNWTLKLYQDSEHESKYKHNFNGWGEQSKYVLKADWIDLSHARNVVSARLWGDIVASRSDFASLPEGLRTSPNYGAIDGFVVKVFFNGIYYGRYDWNIPKDKWTVNMNDGSDNDALLCGEDYSSACFRALWGGVNESGWSDELRDTTTTTVKNQLNDFITFVMSSSDADFIANFGNYADLTSFIDYYIFHYFNCGLDVFAKNQILLSYGGGKYYASSYDMDSTFGLYWNGQRFVSTSYRCQEDYEVGVHNTSNLLYDRIASLFANEVSARYVVLREGVLSLPHIIERFEEYMTPMSAEFMAEDYASTTANGAFTGIPSKTTNNLQQIRNYIAARAAYVDANIIIVPLTALAISGNDSVTGTFATYTAVYTPTNTSQAGVTWSISSGSEYASIDPSTGVLSILVGASANSVTIVATSSVNSSITATKTVTVTYESENELTALAISGSDTVTGVTAAYSVEYTPSNTTETGVTWSITNGGTYAAIDSSAGVLTILNGADANTVTIRATSLVRPAIYAEKTVTVTYYNATTLYRLPQATEFDNATQVNTGVPITTQYQDYTILIDFTNTKTLSSGEFSTIYSEMDINSPWYGVVIRLNSDRTINMCIANTSVRGSAVSINTRTKYAFVVDSTNNTASLYDLDGTLLVSKAITSTKWLSTSNPTPMLGGDQSQTGRYFQGTIHRFEIRQMIMTPEEIADLLADN